MTPEDLASVWDKLRKDATSSNDPTSRVYRALGKTTRGVRASYRPDEDRTELLVEVPASWQHAKEPPQWQGIDIDILPLNVSKDASHHLGLALMDTASEDVFLHFASDLTNMLEDVSDATARATIVEECLQKWNRFFMRGGPTGLSLKGQMGLFAEILFLCDLLESGMEALNALSAWKGPERGYHDFDHNGEVVEVKSTSVKEPRKVWISNERQLDERGTRSLHLLAVTLAHTQGGGKTLPSLIEEVRHKLHSIPGAEGAFDGRLLQAGYLKRHAQRYKRNFTTLKTDAYAISDRTPRIVDLPPGLGDIKYTVLLSALDNASVDYQSIVNLVSGGNDASK